MTFFCWNVGMRMYVVPGEECYSNGLWSNFKLVRADRAEVALLLLAMCSSLAYLPFTMVHRPSSLIVVTQIWCLSSVGVVISKEALDRALVLKRGMVQWMLAATLAHLLNDQI